jgi:hypothetical protein
VRAERDRKVFGGLRFEVTVSPGQTLLLTALRHTKGLGREFFSDLVDSRARQKVLLVRLAQTQYDDRFAPEAGEPPPLVTSDL